MGVPSLQPRTNLLPDSALLSPSARLDDAKGQLLDGGPHELCLNINTQGACVE